MGKWDLYKNRLIGAENNPDYNDIFKQLLLGTSVPNAKAPNDYLQPLDPDAMTKQQGVTPQSNLQSIYKKPDFGSVETPNIMGMKFDIKPTITSSEDAQKTSKGNTGEKIPYSEIPKADGGIKATTTTKNETPDDPWKFVTLMGGGMSKQLPVAQNIVDEQDAVKKQKMESDPSSDISKQYTADMENMFPKWSGKLSGKVSKKAAQDWFGQTELYRRSLIKPQTNMANIEYRKTRDIQKDAEDYGKYTASSRNLEETIKQMEGMFGGIEGLTGDKIPKDIVMIPGIGMTATSPEGQSFIQHAQKILNAQIYDSSGKQINEEEMKRIKEAMGNSRGLFATKENLMQGLKEYKKSLQEKIKQSDATYTNESRDLYASRLPKNTQQTQTPQPTTTVSTNKSKFKITKVE